MNIFALDDNPREAARAHVDRHVVKMPVEGLQMLSTAVRLSWPARRLAEYENRNRREVWKVAHPNHPSTLWARASLSNWKWLRSLTLALLEEHEFRYGLHRSETIATVNFLPDPRIEDSGLHDFSLAVPAWLEEADLPPVITYRLLYCTEKSHLLSWKRRGPPSWLPKSLCSHKDLMLRAFGTHNT